MKELSGVIIKLFDPNNGLILGEDKNEYYFSKMDCLENINLEEGQTLKFKPNLYNINGTTIFKATRISE